ncbi:hypothetical protein RAG37_11520 [Klebsiella pneumoniae]
MRAARYRRAVACARLTLCERQHRAILASPSTRWKAPSLRAGGLPAPAWRGKRSFDCLCATRKEFECRPGR